MKPGTHLHFVTCTLPRCRCNLLSLVLPPFAPALVAGHSFLARIAATAICGQTGRLSSLNLTRSTCRLRWSTQHWLAVYSQESRSLRFFWGVDSSAARPGRVALANGQTGQCLAGSIAATVDSCFRWCRVARDFADHRSRP